MDVDEGDARFPTKAACGAQLVAQGGLPGYYCRWVWNRAGWIGFAT